MTQPERLAWTHPTPAPRPVAPAQPPVYDPAATWAPADPAAYPSPAYPVMYPPPAYGPPTYVPVPTYGPPVHYVTRSKRHTSHAFHLIMTIVTCGLWLPVWVWMTWQNIVIKERTTTRGR